MHGEEYPVTACSMADATSRRNPIGQVDNHDRTTALAMLPQFVMEFDRFDVL